MATTEEGLVTYTRTDSKTMSLGAIRSMRRFIKKTFGAEYIPRDGPLASKAQPNAQEAHEAIRCAL